MNALTELLTTTAIDLAKATKDHPQWCECQDCADLTALWMGLDNEAHAKITAEVWESFPMNAVSDQDAPEPEPEIDLLGLAINTVVGSYDSLDAPDLSEQIVEFIMREEIFQPLRERIYSGLFSRESN